MKYLAPKDYFLGIKVVDQSNWLHVDRTTMFMSGGEAESSDAEALVCTGNYLAQRFATLDIGKNVSPDVKRLFMVARGTVVYGTFFYPLFEIGLERAYAAVELAVHECVAVHGGPNRLNTAFKGSIDWLCRFGWISRELCTELHGTRFVRNLAKHEQQNISMPVEVSRSLHRIARQLMQLATVRDSTTPAWFTDGLEHDHTHLPWL